MKNVCFITFFFNCFISTSINCFLLVANIITQKTNTTTMYVEISEYVISSDENKNGAIRNVPIPNAIFLPTEKFLLHNIQM